MKLKKFQLITKKGCSKCRLVKEWLEHNNISILEWPIEEEWVADKLLKDPNFIQNFCDIESCTIYTPVIRLEETGQYYYKDLFGISGLRENYLKKLLDIPKVNN